MINIIVAMDKKRGIGADNDLLWQRDLPADLAHFKKLTTGTSVVMGRKTFESIGRPLPDRQNIVVTSHELNGDVERAPNLKFAYSLARHAIFVIGGGLVYGQAIHHADRLYVTEVDAEFPQATVFFPEISSDDWRETAREHHAADERNKYPFDFVTYER